MKIYFNRLNEDINIYPFKGSVVYDIIDKYKLYYEVTNLYAYAEYVNKHYHKLKPFVISHTYKSQELYNLEKERIYIEENEYDDFNVRDLVKDSSQLKKMFEGSIDDFLYYNICDLIRRFTNIDLDDIDEEEKEEGIYEYISDFNLRDEIGICFLNKDKKTGIYLIERCFYYDKTTYISCVYRTKTKNEKNSFGIKDGDPLSKEHLIEYAKENVGKWYCIYSGYFDDL